MFQLSAHSRRVTAASLLVVFLNVFFGQALCALVMPGATAHAQEHDHLSRPLALHHEAHEVGDLDYTAGAHHEHGHKHQSPHKSESKGTCCQDDAAAFWASLTHPPKVGVDKLVPLAFTLPIPFTLAVRSQQWDRTQPVLLVARRQLKPKIPDIRIFIQSLTV